MRYITMTPEAIQTILQQVQNELQNNRALKCTNIQIPNKLPNQLKNKVLLNFTAQAWLKMTTLIANWSDECAWHGVVHVNNEERTNFTISDILVYPQTVTGATVNTDELEYFNWKNKLDDDTYNNLRMQGHSHVNMGVSPSGVDTTLYDNMLQSIQDYYIFMIVNKRGEHWCEIYDIKNNIIYENDDIQWRIQGLNLNKFLNESKEQIKRHSVIVQKQQKQAKIYENTHYDFAYGGYRDYGFE